MPDDEIITTEPEEEDPTPDPTPEPEPEPAERTILDDVKLALRLTTGAYDPELTDLVNEAIADLEAAGVINPVEDTDEESTLDPLIKIAVITYCKVHFGSPSDFDRLKRIYDEKKAALSMHTGHTDWGDE